ncbi:MAG TPA: GGDEF domain-containing protein [Urbifossiella sp.]|jgi:diguanylate cyclase (GGDEF)-like protein
MAVDKLEKVEKVTETWITTPKRLFSAATREACLVHIYPTGPCMGRRYPLGDKDLLVGRGDDCDIRIQDNSVSRKHVKVEPTADGYIVGDLGSTNGTFVNDQQLSGPSTLHDGDYLRVGNCLYRYLTGGNIEAEYHEEIYRLTIQDGLTRIHNQRALTEFLDREVARSQRHKRPLSILMFDIDKFKTINDTHGHLCGDFVLRELAECIRGTIRKEDMFARSGGEEFCMVLVETGPVEAMGAAERVRTAIERHPFRFDATPIKLTISVGVATTTGETVITPTDLMKSADDKLYQAKRAGRNRVVA